jgi:hypothetical protein
MGPRVGLDALEKRKKSLAPAEGQILATLYMEITGVYSIYHT